MKSILFVILLAFAACKKEVNQDVNKLHQLPSVTKVTWSAVYAGSNASTKFEVDIISDSTTVDHLNLFRVIGPGGDGIRSPHTGHYSLYDHMGDEPNGSYYYFVFYMRDGTKITLPEFQVY